MPIPVSDTRADWNETIEHGARTLGRSKVRKEIFRAVYSGKTNPKTVLEVAKTTRLDRKQVLTEAKKLSDEGLVHQTKLDGLTAYEKVRFYQRNRDRILNYAANPDKLKLLPTKRRPAAARTATIRVQVAAKRIRAKHVTVDEIPAFSKVRQVGNDVAAPTVSESQFKRGVARLVGEGGAFRDWGGERNDLATTRLRIRGKRREAAFAFKGPGTRGILTPGKMGKNGDQIQRLVLSPGEVFIIQYWGQIAESVREQLARLVQVKSYFEERVIFYGVIDGQDSRRLIRAYPDAFGVRR